MQRFGRSVAERGFAEDDALAEPPTRPEPEMEIYRKETTTSAAKAAARAPEAASAETKEDFDNDAPRAHKVKDDSPKTSDQMASGNTRRMSFSPPPRLRDPFVRSQPTRRHSANGESEAPRRRNAHAGFGGIMAELLARYR